MARSRETQAERLEKQRIRQRANRARRKRERLPTHEDLARGLFDFVFSFHQGLGNDDRLDHLLERVSERLLAVGFEPQATYKVWDELDARYRAGWSLLRQRRSAAELEALQDPQAKEDGNA